MRRRVAGVTVLLTWLMLAWLMLLMAPLARAQGAGGFATLGPLAPTLQQGQSGAWTLSADSGAAVLTNPATPNALRYYTIDWQGSLEAGRSVSVRVRANGGEGAAAGILFRLTSGDPRWIAYLEAASGQLQVLVRRPNAMQRGGTYALPGGRHPGGDVLSISQHGQVAELFANGQLVQQLQLDGGADPNVPAPVGIVAMGMGSFLFADFGFGPGLSGAGPAPVAAGGGTPGRRTLASWTLPTFGAMFGIFAHEFGHFMIGEFHVPATGPEEDVADEFAAMTFIANLKESPEQTAQMAVGGAELWWFLAEDRGDSATPFYDEHAPDRARFAKYACMLYGASPDLFNDLLDKAGIPDRTKQRCRRDEAKLYEAWQKLLTPYRRGGVNPQMPGDQAPNAPGHKIIVVYEPTKNPALRQFAQEIQDSGVFDVIADAISKLYVLPRDTKIVFRDCGFINCFYRPADGSVTMCWEMISFVLSEFKKHGGQIASSASPPSRPSAGSSSEGHGSIQQYLVGLWGQEIKTDNGVLIFAFKLSQDSAFTAIVEKDKKVILRMEGTWSAKAASNNTGELDLEPKTTEPEGVDVKPFHWQITLIDDKSFRNDNGVVVRLK